VKEESEKVGLKLNIQKTKIMASGPITSWKIGEQTVETVADFILGGSQITADGDCSHEIKRRLLLGRKVLTNLDSIFGEGDGTPPQCCLPFPQVSQLLPDGHILTKPCVNRVDLYYSIQFDKNRKGFTLLRPPREPGCLTWSHFARGKKN